MPAELKIIEARIAGVLRELERLRAARRVLTGRGKPGPKRAAVPTRRAQIARWIGHGEFDASTLGEALKIQRRAASQWLARELEAGRVLKIAHGVYRLKGRL